MNKNSASYFEEKRKSLYARNLERAKSIVAKKCFTNYYEVEYSNEDDCVDFRTIPLSDEEVIFLQNLLAEEDEYICALHDKIPFYDKLIENEGYYPVAINFANPLHKMDITAVLMPSADARPVKESVKIEISDEDYTILFAWAMHNRRAPFTRLVQDFPDLFSRLSNVIENRIGYGYPHIVFLDEVERDLYAEIGEPDHLAIIYQELPLALIEVSISEKKMSISYQLGRYENLRLYIDYGDIDAIAMQNAFGVTTYSELTDKMKEMFGYFESQDKLVEFLNEHNIKFEWKNNMQELLNYKFPDIDESTD